MKTRLRILLSMDRYIWILLVCYLGFVTLSLFFLGISLASQSGGSTTTGIIASLYSVILPIYLFVKSFTRYNQDLSIWIGFGLTRQQFLTTNLVYYMLWVGIISILAPILVFIENFIGEHLFFNYQPQNYIPLLVFYDGELNYFTAVGSIFFVYMLGIIICHAFASLLYYLKARPIIKGGIIALTIYMLLFGFAYFGNLLAITFIPIYIVIALAVNYITLMKADIPS